jgi:hypothetical protein
LDGCNFSYSVIMRVMTFLVGVLKSASSIKMRIADSHSGKRLEKYKLYSQYDDAPTSQVFSE